MNKKVVGFRAFFSLIILITLFFSAVSCTQPNSTVEFGYGSVFTYRVENAKSIITGLQPSAAHYIKNSTLTIPFGLADITVGGIDAGAFQNSQVFKTLRFITSSPPSLGEKALDGIADLVILVPTGTVSLYMDNAAYFPYAKNIVDMAGNRPSGDASIVITLSIAHSARIEDRDIRIRVSPQADLSKVLTSIETTGKEIYVDGTYFDSGAGKWTELSYSLTEPKTIKVVTQDRSEKIYTLTVTDNLGSGVIFENNGAFGSMSPYNPPETSSAKLPKCEFYFTRHNGTSIIEPGLPVFLGWTENKDGSGVVFSDEAPVPSPLPSVLYAKWDMSLVQYDTAYYDSTDVFVIYNQLQLKNIADLAASGKDFSTKTVILNTDLDLTQNFTLDGVTYSENTFQGIVTDGSQIFRGIFDGNGKTATVNITQPSKSYQAFIGRTEGATIKNLTVAGSVTGSSDIGGIVGSADGNTAIVSCTNSAQVTGTTKIGGIVGSAQGRTTITNAVNNSIVNSGSEQSINNDNSVGGIVGYGSNIMIENCTNKADIDTSAERLGGIIGEGGSNITIKKCNNINKVSSKKNSSVLEGVGGIAGFLNGGGITLESCENTGTITAPRYIGGVIGYLADPANGAQLLFLTNNASVTAQKNTESDDTKAVGGIAGSVEGATILECQTLSSSVVTGAGNEIGGLIGTAKRVTIQDCETMGSINAKGGKIGGIIGSIGNSSDTYKSYISGGRNGANLIRSSPDGNITRVGGIVGQAYNTDIRNSVKYPYIKNEGSIDFGQTTSIGGIAGWIENCNVTYAKNTGKITGDLEVGGIVGCDNQSPLCSISFSINTGEITGNKKVGGIVGDARGSTITKNENSGVILGRTSSDTIYEYKNATSSGGIVGSINNGIVDLSFNTGTVKSLSTESDKGNIAGGIGGSAKNSVIRRSYNLGNVEAGNETAGGIIGYACGTTNIDKCYNKGKISAKTYTSGITGYTKLGTSTVTILNSYNTGELTGNRSGGLIGYLTGGKIILGFCYSIGKLPSSGVRGSLAGWIDSSNLSIIITNASYYLAPTGTAVIGNGTETSGLYSGPLSEKSSADFNSNNLNSYSGWDNEIWEIKSFTPPGSNGITKRPVLKDLGGDQ